MSEELATRLAREAEKVTDLSLLLSNAAYIYISARKKRL